MVLPTFLIVGTARAATTSLHYYLKAHPQVCMSSIKEPNYFLFDRSSNVPRSLIGSDDRLIMKSVPERSAYERLFRPKAAETVVGEASPLYLYTRETPALIAEELGTETRIIAILREPVSRAFSHFLHVYRGPADTMQATFHDSVSREMGSAYSPYMTGTHFLRLGRYEEQVPRYVRIFGERRVLLLLYEDLARDAAAVLADVARFLDIDPTFRFPVETVYNRSGVVRSRALRNARRALTRLQPRLKAALPPELAGRLARVRAVAERPSKPAPLDAGLQRALSSYFQDTVTGSEELFGRKLPEWRTS